MKLGLAIWPRSQCEWYELGLGSIPDVSIAPIDAGEDFQPVDLLIVDGDNPGPSFQAYMKHPEVRARSAVLIVLGQPTSQALSQVDWDPEQTVFVAKPCQIEDVIQTANGKLEALKKNGRLAKAPAVDVSPPVRKPLGYLSTLRLPDLMQMLCLSNWTGKIEVLNLTTQESGVLFLNAGVMIHSEQGKVVAEPAVYRMLLWGRCEFLFIEDYPPVLQTIKTHWQEIMLEGARIMDEGRQSGFAA